MIQTRLAGTDVMLATIDMPGRAMNVFSEPLMDALEALLDEVERTPGLAGVVITSGKPSFLAGADLSMVLGMTTRAVTDTREEMFRYCGRLGRLFLRLERCALPWVAAVNGTALGGGLELAMACRTRLVADDPRTLLGVPEVKLGLLPGAGGTQRLPRLVGEPLALDMLLSGRSIDPAAATQAGLFESALPADRLVDAAIARVRELNAGGTYRYRPADKFAFLAVPAPARADTAANVATFAQTAGISPERLQHYPAYRAILRCVIAGAGLPLEQANSVEMTRFLDLMFDPVAGNMVNTLFVQRQRLEKAMPGRDALLTSLSTGQLSAEASQWERVFERLGVSVLLDPALAPDTLVIHDKDGAARPIALGNLPGAGKMAPDGAHLPRVWLAARTEHGRVIELSGAGDDARLRSMIGALARRAGCVLLETPGPASVLQTIAQAGESIDDRSEAALAALADGQVSQPAWLDVAAVAAGIAPAWTGGPLTHAWRHPGLIDRALADRAPETRLRVQDCLTQAFALAPH